MRASRGVRREHGCVARWGERRRSPRSEARALMLDIELQVAGVGFRARIEGACDPAAVEARFGAYRAAAGEDAIDLRVRSIDGWRPPRPPTVPYPGAEAAESADGSLCFVCVPLEIQVKGESETALG